MSVSPESIETHYKQQYHAGIERAFAQGDTRVFGAFGTKMQSAEFDYYDRMGIAAPLVPADTRYGDNPISEFEHERRRLSYSWYDQGKPIDPKDLVRVATDPTNEYTTSFVEAANRRKDLTVWENIYGPAYTGKQGNTIVNFVTAPVSGKITVGSLSKGVVNPITTAGVYALENGTEGITVAHDYTGGAAASGGITLAKLRAVRRTMQRLDSIKQDTVLDCWLTSTQFDELLQIDAVINADYSVRKNLAAGNVTEFMGFRFRHSEMIPLDANGRRRCLVATPQAYTNVLSQDTVTDIWKLTDKKNIPYLYVKLGIGGSRMWGELTAEVKCAE